MVLVPAEPGRVRVWITAGVFNLPTDAPKILGANHPFLEEVAQDLVSLCHHPDAGELVISGWRTDKTPISFPIENGAHAGPGPEETRAFALIPEDVPVVQASRNYLRPLDLREGALAILGRSPEPILRRSRRRGSHTETLRIMTYNVHSCIGMDGKFSPGRIARVIALYEPDIVALQELDVGRLRTGEIDQAHVIAHELEMDYHFHPAFRLEEEKYGDAVLTHHSMRLVQAQGLPSLPNRPDLEPRGALWVAVIVNGCEIQLINTHLGLSYRERLLHADTLLGPEWLGHPECRAPAILCGDFNAMPGSTVYRRISGPLHDAQMLLDSHQPQRTWFGRYPVSRIDHVFVSDKITVLGVKVPRTELTCMASDHLPLIVDVAIQ
jgi:endonuclease/exonuclease/phosphatase family metal-dependent hydrolase